MTSLPVLPLIRRFGHVARQDGVLPATAKASRYIVRRARRLGTSGLHGKSVAPPAARGHYLTGIWQTLTQEQAFNMPQAPAVHRRRRKIAMIADLNLPQCRKYRVEQLAEFWRRRGVSFDYAHFQDIPRAVRIMQQATHLMEYRLQSGQNAELLRYEARRLRLPILYDLDDPLFSVSAYATYRNLTVLEPELKDRFVDDAPKYLDMMNGADVLSVSTPGMAEHAALYSARPIHLRRNFADDQTLTAGHAAMQSVATHDTVFRVAFASGSRGHEADFDDVLAPLSDFILAAGNRRILVLGHFDAKRLPDRLRDRVDRVAFSGYDAYLQALAAADCALMPLCDDQFNQCKSAVRVIDASAVGVPSIASQVGDLPFMCKHGLTGFVAKDQGDWTEALTVLAADPRAARQMGIAARKDLERHWAASDRTHIIDPELIEWVEG